MNDKTAQDWGNYWQGRAASESGAALIGVGIETDAEIGAFWDGHLGALPKSARVLDLACGAGSVLRRASAIGLKNLCGVDISDAAIATLKAEFPNAQTVVASAEATGLDDAQFDIVASQFGFEYADATAAAREAARLVAKGGQFLALAHSKSSAIELEVARLGADAKAILESGFIGRACEMFEADMTGATDATFAKAAAAFSGPQAEVLAIAKRAGGIAAHLYQGTQTLYQKRRGYELSDVTNWLNGMRSEIAAYAGRMESMRRAAISEAEAKAVLGALKAGGLKPQPLHAFKSKITGDIIGWIIHATDKQL